MRNYNLLTSDLFKNVNEINKKITDKLLVSRYITNSYNPNQSYCIIYLSNLVDKNMIYHFIIRPLIEYKEKTKGVDWIEESIIITGEIKTSNLIDEIVEEILRGKTILLMDDKEFAWLIETNKREIRISSEPDIDKVLRGPREGFAESLLFNIGLVRRKIVSTNLKFEMFEIGKETKTNYCLCYLTNLIDENLLKMVKERLSKLEIDGVLDTNFISEKIKDNRFSPFKTIGVTERPDTFSSKLLKGKVGLILDGTPVALFMPHLLLDNFLVSDDYYLNFYFSSFARFLRIIGFIFSIIIPAVYVAITTHHREVIPSPLALTIAQSHQDVPLPTVLECFVLLIIFDIIREAGLRTPMNIGQALSVVGAIVIGQAAVQARLVSSPVVIIVALTAISSLVNPSLKGASVYLRFIFLFFAAIFGLYGCVIAGLFLLFYLLSHKSFTIQYVEKLFPFKYDNLKDSIVRLPRDDIHTKER